MTQRVGSARGEHPSKRYLTGLAQLLTFQGEHADAIAVYRDMLKLNPNDVVTTNNLACYLVLSGDRTNEALELINRAIESEGATGALLDSRGMIQLEMGHAEAALLDLNRAIEMGPTAPMYLHLAAATKTQAGPEKRGRVGASIQGGTPDQSTSSSRTCSLHGSIKASVTLMTLRSTDPSLLTSLLTFWNVRRRC